MTHPHSRNIHIIVVTFLLSASVLAVPAPPEKKTSQIVASTDSLTSVGKHRSAATSLDHSSTTLPSPSTFTTKTVSSSAVSGAFTSTSLHAAPSGTTNSSSSLGNTPANAMAALFPMANPVSMWTTIPGAPVALPLSDSTLLPFKEMAGTKHAYTKAPDGKTAMEATYPQGSYNPSHQPRGGFSFYAPGPPSLDFTTAKELTFGYSVMFTAEFQWNQGGKLPGIYGGDNATTATACSGGRRDPTCFSARLMWRANGAGELYTYLPDPSDPNFAANEKVCKIPNSECNPTYGASIARGAFSFTPGEWTMVSERVKLNTAGQTDGELELFVGGKSVISAVGIILRDNAEGRMRGLQVETFFGGSTADWASPVDQQAYFSDFSVAILATL
ncbi:hypothetical protein DFH09DRAFT_1138541 [Mycena vulgaris]|nr:hypothetical protein DFH09DRAFT_1138541 [Mycena vulgaris]